MNEPAIKPLTEADLKAARRSWEHLLTLDPKVQMTAGAMWASVWAEPLMRAAAIGLMLTDKRGKT